MIDLNKLPGGGSIDFAGMIDDGTVYIDKTDLVAGLASKRGIIFFLTRPRRFGKTTLVSTFKELFTNGTKRFENLKLVKENLWHDHNNYQVISLSLMQLQRDSVFCQDFTAYLCTEFAQAGIEITLSAREKSRKTFPCEPFNATFEKLEDNSLVLLIDEYDAPFQRFLHNEKEFKLRRKVMMSFIKLLNDYHSKFRFVFITGIGRFLDENKLQECSNFVDISWREQYAGIVGFTPEEIKTHLHEYLEHAAAELHKDDPHRHWNASKLLQQLIEEYGGYCFDPRGRIKVCNPWNVMLFLTHPREGFSSYWVDSGGSDDSLIEKWLRQYRTLDPDLSTFADFISADYAAERPIEFVTEHVEALDPVENDEEDRFSYFNVLLQTGYFTIRERINPKRRKFPVNFEVGVPNNEVRRLFQDLVAAELTRSKELNSLAQLDYLYGRPLRAALNTEDIDKLEYELTRFVNIFPADVLPEYNNYTVRTLLYITFILLDFKFLGGNGSSARQFDFVFMGSNTVYRFTLKVIKQRRKLEGVLHQLKKLNEDNCSILIGNKKPIDLVMFIVCPAGRAGSNTAASASADGTGAACAPESSAAGRQVVLRKLTD